jgi:hypothetical protein
LEVRGLLQGQGSTSRLFPPSLDPWMGPQLLMPHIALCTHCLSQHLCVCDKQCCAQAHALTVFMPGPATRPLPLPLPPLLSPHFHFPVPHSPRLPDPHWPHPPPRSALLHWWLIPRQQRPTSGPGTWWMSWRTVAGCPWGWGRRSCCARYASCSRASTPYRPRRWA